MNGQAQSGGTLHLVRSHGGVTAVLDDPTFVVPAAEPAESGIHWLRFHVSRFANGTEHARRRAQIDAQIAELDMARLRRESETTTDALLDRAVGGVLDVMGSLARHVPISVLAAGLGIEADAGLLVDDVTTAAAAYPTGGTEEQRVRADGAVERLVDLLGGRSDATVCRLTLLAQGCDATAGLIGNSLNIALHLPEQEDVDAILAETLRYRPPVRGTRRVATALRRLGDATIEPGSTVQLDFDSANRDPDVFAAPDRFDPRRAEPRHLTFGHGFRACPGSDPALAIAAGVVTAVLARCEPAFPESEVEYEPSPLRVPSALVVDVPRSPA